MTETQLETNKSFLIFLSFFFLTFIYFLFFLESFLPWSSPPFLTFGGIWRTIWPLDLHTLRSRRLTVLNWLTRVHDAAAGFYVELACPWNDFLLPCILGDRMYRLRLWVALIGQRALWLAGPQWHALGREEQSKYYELARKERQVHMQLHPGWTARDNYAQGKKRKRRREKPTDAGGPYLNQHPTRVGRVAFVSRTIFFSFLFSFFGLFFFFLNYYLLLLLLLLLLLWPWLWPFRLRVAIESALYQHCPCHIDLYRCDGVALVAPSGGGAYCAVVRGCSADREVSRARAISVASLLVLAWISK